MKVKHTVIPVIVVLVGVWVYGIPELDRARATLIMLEREQRVMSLQPEDVIRECGKPILSTKDLDEKSNIGFWYLTFKGHTLIDGERVNDSLEFFRLGQRLLLTADHNKDMDAYFPCAFQAAQKYGKTLAERVTHD